MLRIKDTLISLDVIEKHFICDLAKCKGACCVRGDSGAPLEDEELPVLEEILPKLKPFLRKEGIKAIEEQGPYVIDIEDDFVTPLVDGKECAYVVFENGIAKCGIEKAYYAGAVEFKKPLSCHLYPVRLHKYGEYTAVNYDKWDICHPARILGHEEQVPVYKFLEESLTRRFGNDWMRHLKIAAKTLKKTNPDE
jgi:hypothetical protein